MADWEVPRTAGKLKNKDKVRVLFWKEDGMSTSGITKLLEQYGASIYCLWEKSKVLRKFVFLKHEIGSGRPKKMTMVLKKNLTRQALKFPQMTAANLQNSVLDFMMFLSRPSSAPSRKI
jgi:hypothetical protein